MKMNVIALAQRIYKPDSILATEKWHVPAWVEITSKE
jgi:hypothetical protein